MSTEDINYFWQDDEGTRPEIYGNEFRAGDTAVGLQMSSRHASLITAGG
jgi:hypothetical protein